MKTLERIKFLDTSMLRKVMGETRVTSEKALVAVAYLRMVKESGSAEQVYMMMEKMQFASLRVITIQ